MTTDGTQQQPDTAQKPAESKPPGVRQKIGGAILRPLLGKDHPPSLRRRFGRGVRNLVKEPGLGVNLRGAGSGLALIAQAVTAGYFLFTLPLLAQPAGVAFLAGVAVIGLYGIGYGLPPLWKNLENVCEKSFRRFNPLRWIRLRAQNVLKTISEKPLMQKLGRRMDRLKDRIAQSPRFKKFMQKPPMQKFMKSRVAAFLAKKLTPHQRDTFLAVLTAQVSLAAFTLGSIGLGFYVAAGGGLLNLGVASVAFAAGTNAFDLTRSICVLLKTSRAKRKAKKAAAKEAASQPAPEPAVTAAAPLPDATAPVFNAKAGAKTDAKAATADAGANKTQTRPVSAAPAARTSPARTNQRRVG